MRTLYVASNPGADRTADILLYGEITELQTRFAIAQAVEFRALPALKVEDFPAELSRHRADILHLAAHGDHNSLALADGQGNLVELTAEMLASFLPPESPPRLVYLNACNSQEIAKKLVELGAVSMAIGTSAPIEHPAAIASAVAFYERILSGLTVQAAHDACHTMLEALSGGEATAVLYTERDAAKAPLHEPSAIIADFAEGKAKADDEGHYSFRLGVRGCPADTIQVMFVTDDSSFIRDEDMLEDNMALLVREPPVQGVLWASDDYVPWLARGDHRLAVIGLRAGGGVFSLDGTLCQAIENRYLHSAVRKIPDKVQEIIRLLRREDGSMLEPSIWDERVASARTSEEMKRKNKKKKKRRSDE